jgi:MoaA/NifB/PqqE/SkfB family radical SAM enzyme
MGSKEVLRLAYRALGNLIWRRPLAISLEITHSCNCRCRHCDKGGIRDSESRAPSQRFSELVRELTPVVAQISGGEPLLRTDVEEIIRDVKAQPHSPIVVLVTNGLLLNPERYLQLKEAGVDEFSISVDFPDERHDINRGVRGLFQHLKETVPQLAGMGNRDITVISVIRSDNLKDLPALLGLATRWGVRLNLSSYTPLRTGEQGLAVRGQEQLSLLRRSLSELLSRGRGNGSLFSTPHVLWSYYRFYRNGCYMPGCRAGHRSLVINPDGALAPCAMQPCSYDSQRELVSNFTNHNLCGGCYVSLRANTEKPVIRLLRDTLRTYLAGRKGDASG